MNITLTDVEQAQHSSEAANMLIKQRESGFNALAQSGALNLVLQGRIEALQSRITELEAAQTAKKGAAK
jgi:hypothetical protein